MEVKDHSVFLSPPSQFYVYLLSRPDGREFYVGVGKVHARKVQRIFQHEEYARLGKRTRKCCLIRSIWKSGGEVIRAVDSWHDSKGGAFAREMELIAELGRVEIATGHLVNMNAGGTGQIDPGPETRAAMRKAQLRNSDAKRKNAPHLAAVLPDAISAAQRWRTECPSEFRAVMLKAAAASGQSRFRDEVSLAAWKVKLSGAQVRRAAANPAAMAKVNAMGREAAEAWKAANPDAVKANAKAATKKSLAWMKANPDQHRENCRKAAAAAVVKRQEKAKIRACCRELVERLGITDTLPAWREPLARWQEFEAWLAEQVADRKAA